MQLEEEQDNQNNKIKHRREPLGSPARSTRACAEQRVSQQEQQQVDCQAHRRICTAVLYTKHVESTSILPPIFMGGLRPAI